MRETRISNLLGKITVFFVTCCLVMGSFVVNTALALDGSGTEGDPWRINSLEDFNDFAADANYWDDYTRLETDVNLAGRVYERAVIAPDVNDDDYRFQGTAFTGVFDGNNYAISNFTCGAGNRSFVGLFGYIDGGQVKNLGVESGSISGWNNVGGLIGFKQYSSVSNCYSTGDVSGTGIAIGGLVGNTKGTISNCYSTGDVNGVDSVGGLVGNAIFSSVSNCYSTGDVSGTGDAIGGLAGYTLGSVSNCYSTGNVNGDVYVGGLMGFNRASISNCYSTGDVNGGGSVGGLMGWNSEIVWNSFWDTDTQNHGVTESIGLNEGYGINVEGLPTAQLYQQSTFTDWDFINAWNIGENQTYPYLRIYLAGDINKDHINNFLDLNILCNQWMEGQ
ncbi:MAG: GLUG motif-containing protein [Planctomycetota bacterium]|jgi:hypothetical protein